MAHPSADTAAFTKHSRASNRVTVVGVTQLEDARRITDKANLVGIRFGGAVANVTVDPATLTLAERRRLVQVGWGRT